jgi:hypothetical protein
MKDENSRGLNCPDRQAESTENDMTCPHCGTLILALVTRGPSEHVLDPCGCRVTTTTARALAGGPDRGRGVATDGRGYEVSDRDTDEMTLVELRKEFSELQDKVDFWKPYEGQEEVWDRRDEVWKALRERADVDIPECPECNGQHWSQAPGDPVECLECGWTATREVEEGVHNAWDRITEPDRGEGVATDGGTSSDGTDHPELPDNCRVCKHEMREILTPGETRAECSNCNWGWSA